MTIIVALPLIGGVVAGLIADGALGTSPLFVLSGLAIGTLVTVLWLRGFITSNVARMRTDASRPEAPEQKAKADNH